MPAPTQSKCNYRFGLFDLDLASRKLSRKGEPVRLQELPFRVLSILVERAGKIVTREELQQSLWPEGTYVEFDGSLNAALKKLRFALGDDAENPLFIETVPKRGYRFIAPVSIDQTAPVAEQSTSQATASPATSVGSDSPAKNARPWLTFSLAAVALVLAGSGWWYFLRYRSVVHAVHAAPKAIAVLPFSNAGAGPDYDYLRYAIADDLVTDLTYARSLSVRPFASTTKYGAQPYDPGAAGKELHVGDVVAGSFMPDQGKLRVELELVDVAENQVVWRDQVTVGPQELIALHDKLALSASRGLLTAMKVSDATAYQIPTPKNEEAFELFLTSEEIRLDPGPNQVAIKKLEQSVSLDDQYAPAWGKLGWRYYIDYHYGNGGEAAKAKLLHAFQRQAELDPNQRGPWNTIRVEQGDLNGAYQQMMETVTKRPNDAGAHFGMSYVLRYAGLVDESGKECDVVFSLDPIGGYRSCATAFILSGDYAQAEKFIRLDEGSGFAALTRLEIALRLGNTDAVLSNAIAAEHSGYQYVQAKLARTCLSHPSQSELAKVVAETESDPVSSRDPEILYQNAEALAFCKQDDAALRQLKRAINGNYCSYPALDKDPLFDLIRQRPEFAEVRQAGIECQQDFLAHRLQVDASLAASH